MKFPPSGLAADLFRLVQGMADHGAGRPGQTNRFGEKPTFLLARLVHCRAYWPDSA